ncbi:MAG: restriction endonuclease subunit S [Hoeflea sp.]|uniref:restriction endonuclease subunit S n=1 Tax=Hoeflea sp. TaxID=1940281 RepID=UPI003EF1A82A
MAGKYRAYPAYKPSGVEWLGGIPEGWERTYLGFACSVKARLGWKGLKAEEYVDDGFIFLATPNIKNDSIDFDNVNYITKKRYAESPEIALEVGDVLVTKDGSTTGTSNVVRSLPRPATVNSSIAVIRSDGAIDSVFLYYFFLCEFTQSVINRVRGGMGVPHLFQADLRKFDLLIPPLPEQTKIGAFLDHETTKIDALIAKQQRLIDLLEEKRQAMISHAVTKGLNPNAPLRPSGTDWLGDVPEHWEVKRLGNLFRESNRRASTHEELEFPILSVSIHHGISDKELNEDELDRKVTRSDDKSLYKVINENDLAYNMMRAWQGGFGASTLNGLVSPAYVVCNPTSWLPSSYFELVLRTPNAVTELKRFSRGITDFRLRLYWDEFKNIEVPIPSCDEVADILKATADRTSKYADLKRKAQSAITLLKERRTALISAAVTGKIDVRDWQPPKTDSDQHLGTAEEKVA